MSERKDELVYQIKDGNGNDEPLESNHERCKTFNGTKNTDYGYGFQTRSQFESQIQKENGHNDQAKSDIKRFNESDGTTKPDSEAESQPQSNAQSSPPKFSPPSVNTDEDLTLDELHWFLMSPQQRTSLIHQWQIEGRDNGNGHNRNGDGEGDGDATADEEESKDGDGSGVRVD